MHWNPALKTIFRRPPSESEYLIRRKNHAYNDLLLEQGFTEAALSEGTKAMTLRDDSDPLAPQREAAFFYGLFLRGHSLEALRQDIDIPRGVVSKWVKAKDFQGGFRADLDRVYQYRKQVLAIFDGLVSSDHARLQ